MKYRFLETEEWSRLEAFLEKDKIPNPVLAKVAVAETEHGEIAGFLVVQMVIHMEPLRIVEKYRHAVRFDRLAAKIDEAVGHKNYYAFSETPLIEKMLKFVKFIKLPYSIWKKT